MQAPKDQGAALHQAATRPRLHHHRRPRLHRSFIIRKIRLLQKSWWANGGGALSDRGASSMPLCYLVILNCVASETDHGDNIFAFLRCVSRLL